MHAQPSTGCRAEQQLHRLCGCSHGGDASGPRKAISVSSACRVYQSHSAGKRRYEYVVYGINIIHETLLIPNDSSWIDTDETVRASRPVGAPHNRQSFHPARVTAYDDCQIYLQASSVPSPHIHLQAAKSHAEPNGSKSTLRRLIHATRGAELCQTLHPRLSPSNHTVHIVNSSLAPLEGALLTLVVLQCHHLPGLSFEAQP